MIDKFIYESKCEESGKKDFLVSSPRIKYIIILHALLLFVYAKISIYQSTAFCRLPELELQYLPFEAVMVNESVHRAKREREGGGGEKKGTGKKQKSPQKKETGTL